MNMIKKYMILAGLAIFGAAVALPATSAQAFNPLEGACSSGSTSEVCQNRNEQVEPVIATIVNTLLYIIGAVSVLVIIIAGIMYSISSGDSGRVSKAKNMLLYAVVGLVVAFFAYAIVNWVFNKFM